MKVTETKLKQCYIIQPQIFHDERGYFVESYNHTTFQKKTGLEVDFIQDNESKSSRGVLRGLHYQKGNFAQAKLVRVIKGRVLDVAVDLRPTSETYGEHVSLILSGDNKKQLFVPRGFAHGFLVLEDDTIFSYKCDNYYKKESEAGIIYNDKTLNINWGFNKEDLILSEKDLNLPAFKSALK